MIPLGCSGGLQLTSTDSGPVTFKGKSQRSHQTGHKKMSNQTFCSYKHAQYFESDFYY